jgi:uncharacterized membrane protein YfcA
MAFLLFLICLLASTIGALVGAGGGVIIKPVVDLFGIYPVSTVSFLSACTVLSMSVFSTISTRGNGIALRIRTSTPLAAGAVAGGIFGNWLFQLVRTSFESERTLGAFQAICLIIIMFVVFVYTSKKDELPSMQVKSLPAIVLIGFFLGVISSFLGIGGGPYNVAVLFLFFSMDAKEAAKNSIYIILLSQIANIASFIVRGAVPAFGWLDLALMIAGGIGGAIVGAAVGKRIDNKAVEKLLKALIVVIIVISAYNLFRFIYPADAI